jgi:hypothetical protein
MMKNIFLLVLLTFSCVCLGMHYNTPVDSQQNSPADSPAQQRQNDKLPLKKSPMLKRVKGQSRENFQFILEENLRKSPFNTSPQIAK